MRTLQSGADIPADRFNRLGTVEYLPFLKMVPHDLQPQGKARGVFPDGDERQGSAARFADMVRTSDMYIWSGSLIFSPIAKAEVVVVGVMMTSAFSKAFLKSLMMSVRP